MKECQRNFIWWKSTWDTIDDTACRTHGNVDTYNVHVFIWRVYMNNKMLQKSTQYKTVEYITVLSAINDHTILLWGIKSKVSYTSLLKQFCKSLHWTVGYQAIYTSLWLVSFWEFHSPLSVAWRSGWYKSGFTILSGRSSSLFSSLWMGNSFFVLSLSTILLQQVRNSATLEKILYKVNDIKYKNGINNITNSSWIGNSCILSYIIWNSAKANEAQTRQSIMLK